MLGTQNFIQLWTMRNINGARTFSLILMKFGQVIYIPRKSTETICRCLLFKKLSYIHCLWYKVAVPHLQGICSKFLRRNKDAISKSTIIR
jgi:hypothetical protein